MKPWIILACISLVLDAFEILGANVCLLISVVVNWQYAALLRCVLGIIGSIAGIGLQVHYIDVVYSHKKEVEEQSRVEIVAREQSPDFCILT